MSDPNVRNVVESWATSPSVRRNMQANRRRDTNPELAVRRKLHAEGYRFRVDWALPFDRRRRADVAFTRKRVVVFIDGCFWHRCPEHYVPPKSHADYWETKTSRNAARDADTTRRMEELGWTVLRYWAHSHPNDVVLSVEETLAALPGR